MRYIPTFDDRGAPSGAARGWGVGVLGEDLGQGDERPPVVRPGGDAGHAGERDRVRLARRRAHPAGQGVDRRGRGAQRGGEALSKVGQDLARRCPVANRRFRAVEPVPEQETRPLHGSEEVGNTGERRSLHVLVEDGRRSGGVGATLDLGDLEVPVHLVGHPDQHPVPFEVAGGIGERPVGHGQGGGYRAPGIRPRPSQESAPSAVG